MSKDENFKKEFLEKEIIESKKLKGRRLLFVMILSIITLNFFLINNGESALWNILLTNSILIMIAIVVLIYSNKNNQ